MGEAYGYRKNDEVCVADAKPMVANDNNLVQELTKALSELKPQSTDSKPEMPPKYQKPRYNNPHQHKSKDCKEKVPCEACGSESHASAIHLGFIEHKSRVNHGEEKNNQNIPEQDAVTKCTQICKQQFSGKSCAKIVQVKIHKSDSPNKTLTSYAILDDQSNKTLVYSSVLDTLV
ncbi:unnamed protein product [Mytilus edulis]|uniref:Uncharacterized protein n=1 Tax=Mytilus edulis TaxID=6550 RepID=A0A8S3S788_MYTED|nr:unnamed protein product [Mytilus edulis]